MAHEHDRHHPCTAEACTVTARPTHIECTPRRGEPTSFMTWSARIDADHARTTGDRRHLRATLRHNAIAQQRLDALDDLTRATVAALDAIEHCYVDVDTHHPMPDGILLGLLTDLDGTGHHLTEFAVVCVHSDVITIACCACEDEDCDCGSEITLERLAAWIADHRQASTTRP